MNLQVYRNESRAEDALGHSFEAASIEAPQKSTADVAKECYLGLIRVYVFLASAFRVFWLQGLWFFGFRVYGLCGFRIEGLGGLRCLGYLGFQGFWA